MGSVISNRLSYKRACPRILATELGRRITEIIKQYLSNIIRKFVTANDANDGIDLRYVAITLEWRL